MIAWWKKMGMTLQMNWLGRCADNTLWKTIHYSFGWHIKTRRQRPIFSEMFFKYHVWKNKNPVWIPIHYNDVIMGAIASQITASRLFTQSFIQTQIKRKHQSSASLAFVRGIHRGPVNSSHKWPVTRKMFPFDDVIMSIEVCSGGFSWQ